MEKRHSRFPWNRSDEERVEIISGLLKLSNRFGGLKHRSVIWLYREYDSHKRKFWNSEREIKAKNVKIKELSIELSKYKRKFGKLEE